MKKFNLRDLFWLALVVAMGCGWWMDRSRQHAEWRQRLSEEVMRREMLISAPHPISRPISN